MEFVRRKPHPKPQMAAFIALALLLTVLMAFFVWWKQQRPKVASVFVPLPYAGPVFTEVSAEAGLTQAQADRERLEYCEDSSGKGESCMAKAMSGGAAAADYDHDGHPDLFMTRVYGKAILYRNKGDGTFEDQTANAGISTPDNTNGAAWTDVDNDGDQDLYVTTIDEGRFYLYINDGQGRFSEQAERRGAALKGTDALRQGFSVAVGDYDNDGWVDLYTSQWGRGMDETFTRLLHNLGPAKPGFFEDATVKAGFSPYNNYFYMYDDGYSTQALKGTFVQGHYSGKFAFAPAFADFDADGWQDLAVAADFGTSRLFWNNRDGTFSDGTEAARVGTDENGMGSAIGDLNGDGRPDWFVTSIFSEGGRKPCVSDGCMQGTTGNRLYVNLGGRKFVDATDAFGIRDGGWGWGTAFIDYDNDGDQDLVMTNGMTEEPFTDDAMRFWMNDGAGRLVDRSPEVGMTDDRSGKGLLLFDYDSDGDLDVLISNNAGTPLLFRNDGGNRNDWLRVTVRGASSNRDGIGAVVRVTSSSESKPLVREIGTGTHFLGQSEKTAHFGLGRGSAPVAEVRVTWPKSGKEQVFTEVRSNTTLTVTEPE